MVEESSLSIEETNKLRLSLGLKPLNVGPSDASNTQTGTALSSEAQERTAAENYLEKRKAEEQAKLDRDTADRVRKARERAERDRKIRGKTLAEDDDEEDTLAWIRRTKSKPVAEAQAVAPKAAAAYTEQDLTGIKVGHDLDDIEGGNEVILTLKDGDVLDDDADVELVNVDLVEQQALKKKLESKKRKSVYTAYEDDEIDETTGKKKILARYDEDIDGNDGKSSGFVIGAETTAPTKTKEGQPSEKKRVMVSLDSLDTMQPMASDYAEPIAMKKPKKKKKVLRKARADPEDEEKVTAATTETKSSSDSRIISDNLVDDEDLQASLAKQRRLALQKRKLLRPEDIASTIPDRTETDIPSAGATLDETAEFVRGLQDIRVLPPRPKRETSKVKAESPSQTVDVDMADVTPSIKRETSVPEVSTTGLEDEATLNGGLGSVMKMLQQKRVLEQDPSAGLENQQHEAWLAKHRKVMMDLDLERRRVRDELRNSPKYRNMSARDREALAASENRRLDALEAKAQQDRFKDYKPVVKIIHKDEFGREMTPKEAFKYMSHQFHGKESGSGKTAKKLAQIEKEKAAEQRPLFK